jgi:branched-chain amino acid transport system ATP-binding protein
VIQVSDLNVFYGKSQVVFNLELTVGDGEIVTLLGRNGAGKTSTLLGIAGEAATKTRSMTVEGHEIGHLPSFKRVRAGISMVPSGSRAFPNLTVEENLAMVRGASNGTGWTVRDVYTFFPALAELKNSSGSHLSGGERQMLAIGRAMVARPKLLMLDEPSEGLAPIIVAQIGELVRQLAGEGLAVLLTEQNHRLALAVADRAYFIEKGRVVWTGPTADAREGDLLERYLAV